MTRLHFLPLSGQSDANFRATNPPMPEAIDLTQPMYVVGTEGKDVLYSLNGNDTMLGLGGNDSLFARGGNDSIAGGGGIDWIYAGDGNDSAYGGAGQDVIMGDTGDDKLYGEARLDRLYGDDGNDTLWGGDDFDILAGGAGADVLYGGAGADYFDFHNFFEVGLAPGTIDRIEDFEDGIDKIRLNGMDSDTVHHGNNVFRLSQTAQHDGLPGSLRVVIANGDTFVMGDRDGDSVSDFSIQIVGIHTLSLGSVLARGSSASGDILSGMAQSAFPGQFITGTAADDQIYGTAGNDTIEGLGGFDELHAGAGDDEVFGGDDGDKLYCDDGADTAYGGMSNDILYGGLGDDKLFGEPGNDYLLGGDGNDTLAGIVGNDTLNGGSGADYLIGGEKADVFAFYSHTETGLAPGSRDIIADFEVGLDKIDLRKIDADAVRSGNNVFRLSQTTLHDGLPGSLRVVDYNGNTFVMADRDGDKVSDFTIQLEGIYQLTASDFYL